MNLGAPNDVPAAAHAFATAFVADVEAAAPLKAALLRKQIGRVGLTRIVVRDLDAMHRGRPGPALFPNLRAVAREFMDQQHRPVQVKVSGLRDGLGQDFSTIANVIGAAAGAAANIYSAVANADMQKQLLKLQQQRNDTAIQIAELQANTARTQLAAANVAATGVASGTPGAAVLQAVGGWPVIGGAAAAIALGVGTYFAFGHHKR